MRDTHFYLEKQDALRLAAQYRPGRDDKIIQILAALRVVGYLALKRYFEAREAWFPRPEITCVSAECYGAAL